MDPDPPTITKTKHSNPEPILLCRMGAVEAERRAAAEEATEWFKQADEKSLKESDFDGLARQKHIMDARLAPWSKDVSEKLEKTGLSPDYAEKVMWRPPQFPIGRTRFWAPLLLGDCKALPVLSVCFWILEIVRPPIFSHCCHIDGCHFV